MRQTVDFRFRNINAIKKLYLFFHISSVSEDNELLFRNRLR